MQDELKKKGLNVIIPSNAEQMKRTGDYDASHYKTWYKNKADYHKKTALITGHFNEVKKADAILVVNNEKHGISNYIGGNALMEMAIAFYLGIPIYILNEIPKESTFLEEIIGLNPIVLHGKLDQLVKAYITTKS